MITSTNTTTANTTDVIKHRNVTDIMDLLNLVTIEVITPASKILPYQNLVQFNGYYEDMRRYYGSLITLYAEYMKEGRTYLTLIGNISAEAFVDIYRQYNTLLEMPDKTIKQWMELVVMYSAIVDKYHFYKDQIPNYEWVDDAFVIETSKRILDIIPKDGMFEHICPHTEQTVKHNNYNLRGVIDYISKDELWEFKCVSSLTDDHKIQCGAYISLYYVETGRLLPCKLFNVRTGELVTITVKNPRAILELLARK